MCEEQIDKLKRRVARSIKLIRVSLTLHPTLPLLRLVSVEDFRVDVPPLLLVLLVGEDAGYSQKQQQRTEPVAIVELRDVREWRVVLEEVAEGY